MSHHPPPVVNPPSVIERVVNINPNTTMQLMESGRAIQVMPIAPGRYRIRIIIRQEK